MLFLVTNGNLILLFFILEQIVCTRCLLFIVMNGNLTLVFLFESKFNYSTRQRGYFLLLSLFGEVVLLCTKGKPTIGIKCEQFS